MKHEMNKLLHKKYHFYYDFFSSYLKIKQKHSYENQMKTENGSY